MPKEIIPIDPQLSENLRIAEAELVIAKKKVEDAQSAIYLAVQSSLPEKGTIHATGIKIATGVTEKWDQIKLALIETAWPTKSNLPFPFKKEYKPDGKQINYLRENAKDAYDLLQEALTTTPKKPSFELEEVKE